MATRAITALFDDYEEAAKAVDRIEAEGVPHADIAIVASNEDERHAGRVGASPGAAAHERGAADGAGAGATVGGVLGGGAGLLAGLGLIAIPGLGPVVAAGWLVAAVTGAGVGAAAGGLLGALTGAGLSHADAETYAEGVRRGGTLVTVRAQADTAERVMHLLEKSGSIDLDERAQDWRAQGWTGGIVGRGGDRTNAAATDAGLDTADGEALMPTAEPRPVVDPEMAPSTRLPPGGIR